ncbi:MAG: hypothetical protein RR420_00835 [Anaerovoracaceae bacterium]
MFAKYTTFSITRDDLEVIDSTLVKTAAVKLPDEHKYDPDYLYLRVRAVSAGEYWGANKNNDYFPEEELKKQFRTFLSAHTFKNHDNKDVAKAIGDVISAEWDDKMKGVYLVIRIDRKIAPTIVRGFEKGFMTDVSMGCRVSHVVCSICGKKARTRKEYCEHLLTMKGKTLDNGKKVYEINIEPKFHDISAVLTGAERVAKAVGIMITGDKVAFTNNQDKSMEKTAGLVTQQPSNIYQQEKVASYNMDEIFIPKTANENDIKSKVAEIKKQLNGRIVRKATEDFLNRTQQNVTDLIDILKTIEKNQWDKAKCKKIANYIEKVSEQKRIPKGIAFDQFLRALDFAMIEISPLEFHDIMFELYGVDRPDFRHRPISFVPPKQLHSAISSTIMPSEGANISTVPRDIIDIMNNMSNSHSIPTQRVKTIIIKRSEPKPFADLAMNEMMKIVMALAPERSGHRQFILKRMDSIGNSIFQRPKTLDITGFQRFSSPMSEGISSCSELFKHYAPFAKEASEKISPNELPLYLTKVAYNIYQQNRVEDIDNGTLDYGLTKFAELLEVDNDCLEKTAGARIKGMKASIAGIPIAYAYSGYQRSKANNGHELGNINKFIAENPGSAATINLLLTPLAVRKGFKTAKNIKSGKSVLNKIPTPKEAIKNLDKLIVKKFANENDELIEKLSSDSEFTSIDIFSNKDIDTRLLKKYSTEQLGAIKVATVLNLEAKEDLADGVLHHNGLSDDDVYEYLKEAETYLTMEIEKTAGVMREVGENFVNGALFNSNGKKKAVSLLSLAPGLAVDGVIISKLMGGSSNKPTNKI